MPLLTEMWSLEQGYSAVFSSSHTVCLSTTSTRSLSSLFLLSTPLLHPVFTVLSFLCPPPTPSLHSFPSILPHFRLHISIPISPLTTSYSAPSFLRPSDFMAIHRQPFNASPCSFQNMYAIFNPYCVTSQDRIFFLCGMKQLKCHCSPLDRTPVSHEGLAPLYNLL